MNCEHCAHHVVSGFCWITYIRTVDVQTMKPGIPKPNAVRCNWLFLLLSGVIVFCNLQTATASDTLLVNTSNDFELDGKGSHVSWQQTGWQEISKIDSHATPYVSRFKILYSDKGIYLLFHGTDNRVTGKYKKDFSNMFNADVFEAFFHPDPSIPLYFEYEINAHNKELPILVPHLPGGVMGWRPWHYEGNRKTRKAVHIEKESGQMKAWTAEVFIPFALLQPLSNNYPKAGAVWMANFCRLDYDTGKMIKWSWAPIAVSFHEYKKYRPIKFN